MSADPRVHGPPKTVIPVLGIPVRFETNSEELASAVEESFGFWRALNERPDLVARRSVRVRLVIHAGDEGPARPIPMTYRLAPERVLVHTPGSVGVADTRRGEATAYVTPALAQERARFRFGVLEMLTLVLVTMRDRHPVHAAAIKRNGGALLLAGPPGAGKSTLAYLASRHGADLLSDDAAYIQLAPRFRVWAVPGCVRLLPDACARFPELQGRSPVSLPNGDDKVPVEVSVGGAFAVPVEGRAAVCLLERDRGPVTLLPASPGEIEEALADGLGPARTLYKGETARAHARLASGGGWRLGLSDDPREALPHLDAMLDAVAHREC